MTGEPPNGAVNSAPKPAILNVESVLQQEKRFTDSMKESRRTGVPAEAILRTDDRVLARITDGIYRQPSSALRELISNAYDADATEIFIDTDAPRYSRIEIRDNGLGMDEEALSRLIHHIGGSSKRTSMGKDVGTTSAANANVSPGGRPLIGKIGIGLFSVSQLTSNFQIVTKTKGSDYRLLADVALKTYVEDASEEAANGKFETGKVQVVAVPADDAASHGTLIVLRNLHPRARDILRSRERWERFFEQEAAPEEERDPAVTAPTYHLGALLQEPAADEPAVYKVEPKLPWKKTDSPLSKFKGLIGAVENQVGLTQDRPDIATTLDNYLSTLWTLSLSAPIEYVNKHPFDLTNKDDPVPYLLTQTRGQASKLALEHGQCIREAAKLTSKAGATAGGFKVFVDQIELRRPIAFKWWPSERQAIQHPLIFVGRYAPDMSKVPARKRGGALDFEAYLFWNSKVVPKENNGVLVRINGASGALFDDQFMKYQVSEQTRLRQITAEIFVHKGLDAALNIDRESFNYSHPHYVILSKWLHSALRQLANTHKALGAAIRSEQKEEKQAEQDTRLNQFAEQLWSSTRREISERPPRVEMVQDPTAVASRRLHGVLALDRSKLLASKPPTRARQSAPASRETKIKALATVLDGFGVFDEMSYDDQHKLINAILVVFTDDTPA